MDISLDNVKSVRIEPNFHATGSDMHLRSIIITLADGRKVDIDLRSQDQIKIEVE